MKFIPNDKHPAQHRRQKEQIPVISFDDGLRCCPMKPGLRTVCWRVSEVKSYKDRFTISDCFAYHIVEDCNCPGCRHFQDVFNNPYDAFLSRFISKKKEART